MGEPAVKLAEQIPPGGSEKPLQARSPGKPYRIVIILLASVFMILSGVSYYWYIYLERYVGTDDAYIEADLFPVNSRIMGYMKDVNVEEGDTVKKGQVLASIDDADIDFELNFKKMKLQKAETDLKRAQQLHASNAISEFDLENAEANYKANLADYQGTEIKLRYSRVLSPSDGVVAKRSVQPGQFVQPGQVLVVVVDNRKPWIKANFKETQIEHLNPGQDVRIWLDSYPNALIHGKVETIFPSSGAKLSILPPENATGNFTRIVQRIPVKISVQEQSGIYLRPGMSVQVSVDTESGKKQVNQTGAADEGPITFRHWAAVVGVALGAFMAILDIQIINASLREIQGALSLDLNEGGWISTAYLIAEIIVIPLTAFFSEALGARRYIMANTIVFVFASACCGCSWNLTSMIAFRILQGLSGGTLIPMSFQTILTMLPPAKRNIGLAIFGLTATLAPTLGPAIGGYLTDSYGWRSIFFLNVAPGILMLGLIAYGMEKTKFHLDQLRELDITGSITMALGLGTLTYVLEEGAQREWFSDPVIRVCGLICAASLSLFLAIQFLKDKPLLNLRLLFERNFGIAALVTVLASMALYGGVFATAMYLGQVQDYSSQDIGAAMMWIGIPQLFVLPLLPWLMNRFDARVLIFFGFCLFTYSNWLNYHLDVNYAGEQFRDSLILRALGQPLFMIPLSAMGMATISKDEAGHASSIYNVLRNLGGSIGIALTSTFVVTRMSHHLFAHTVTLDPDSVLLQNQVAPLKTNFMINGFISSDATTLAGQNVLQLAYRESLIQSFADVFFIVAIGLLLCSFLTLALRKTKTNIALETH